MTRIRIWRGLAACAAVSLAFAVPAGPASAQQRQVDGHLWAASSVAQKQAYLIGVANVLAVEQAYRVKKGNADASAPTSRYLRSMDAATIEAIQRQLDAWYQANPSRLDTPVLGVLWMAYVQPR